MNMKRILVLIMTFAMLMSTFAPTLGVFAEELHDHENGNKETLDYVSLGDSMSNGIGMDGYDITDNPNSDNDGRNGYLEVAPNAYPAKFAAWLAGYTGAIANGQTEYKGDKGTVNLTQLATSGARIEDVYYMLTLGTDKEFESDYWTVEELLKNSDRWGDPNNKDDATHNEAIADKFQESIKNADVVSLATGNGNFGVFLMGRIMNLVGFGDPTEDNEVYDYYTIENALALISEEITVLSKVEELTSMVFDVYYNTLAIVEAMGLPVDVARIADLVAYTTASYVIYTMKTIDLIVEMNPDVTIMMLPLINNGLDFNFSITLNGITKEFNAGDFLGMLYAPLNAFLAAYPTAKQAQGDFLAAKDHYVNNKTGEIKEDIGLLAEMFGDWTFVEGHDAPTFLYAALPTDEEGNIIQVETYAQAFDQLYVPVEAGMTEETYPANRLFCHNRFIGDILDFVFGQLQLDYVPFDEYDVRAFELAKANGTLADYQAVLQAEAISLGYTTPETIGAYISGKLTSMSMYLGFVEAILASMKNAGSPETAPNMNFDEITLNPSAGSIMESLLGGLTSGLMDKVTVKIGELVVEQYGEYIMAGAIDEATASLLVMPEAMKTVLLENGTLATLLSLYGKLKLAWGLSAHPSVAGHDTLAQSLINAYENEYTVQKETLKNLIFVVTEYYDEAYEFGYAYADKEGYIDVAAEAVKEAIEAIKVAIAEVESGVLGTTDELTE